MTPCETVPEPSGRDLAERYPGRVLPERNRTATANLTRAVADPGAEVPPGGCLGRRASGSRASRRLAVPSSSPVPYRSIVPLHGQVAGILDQVPGRIPAGAGDDRPRGESPEDERVIREVLLAQPVAWNARDGRAGP